MRKALKIGLYTLGSLLLLLILVVVLLNTPWGQDFVRKRAVAFLSEKLKTEVHIGKLGYGLPRVIFLEDVLFKDQAKDTLLAARKLRVNINMLKLISGKVEVSRLELAGVNAHIYRNAPDTVFNFGYIIDAFAGKPTEQVEDVKQANDTSSLSFNVDKLELADIRFRFDDYTGGTRFGMALDTLDLRLSKFDPIKMIFHVRNLDIAGLQTYMIRDVSYLPPQENDTTVQEPIELAIDDLKLRDISFKYDDIPGKMKMDYILGRLETKPKEIDLKNQRVNIEKLLLENTSAVIWIGPASAVPEQAEEVAEDVADSLAQGNWVVVVDDINLNAVNFKMDNDNEPRLRQGIDYAHLLVTELAFAANEVVFTGDTISGRINHLALKEQSGLDLQELKASFAYNPQGAMLQDLYLKTPRTVLQDHIEVGWPSLEALQHDPNVMRLNVNLQQSVVGIYDLLIFVPTLAEQQAIRKNRNGQLKLDAILEGFLSSLGIEKFIVSGLGNTMINVNGRLSNVADPNKLAYDLNILKLQSSRNDIAGFMPAAALESVRIPDRFGATGKLAGNILDYRTPGLTINTTDGNAFVSGSLLMSPGTNREKYDLKLRTEALNIGRILKQDTVLGVVTAGVVARGRSFNVNNMDAVVTANVQSAGIMGYNYSNLSLDGKIVNKITDIFLNSEDPNARLALEAHGDLNGKYPSAVADINIDSIDLQALNLYSSELRTRGQIHIDAPELNPDYPNATLTWLNPLIVAGGSRYFTDSFTIISRPSVDSGQNIIVDFDALYARLTGRTPLTRIGDVVQEHINRHYGTLAMIDSTARSRQVAKQYSPRPDSGVSSYDLALVADVKDRPILHGILPDLEYLDTIHIEGGLNDRDLFLDATLPRVVYAGTSIENGLATIRETDSAINYDVTVDRIAQDKMEFWYARANGSMRGKTINANVSTSDTGKRQRFAVSANMEQQGDRQVVQLLPGLVLNYNTWNVAQPNQIVFGNGGFYVQNVAISNAGQQISANSRAQQFNSPADIAINNFIIGDITQIFSKDTTLANGLLNGKVAIEAMQPALKATGDINVQYLSVLGDTVGNLAVLANNKTENTIGLDMKITGHENDIALAGNYYPRPVNGNALDLLLNLRALNFRAFEGIMQHQVRNSSGFIRGELNIKGTPAAPLLNGELRTDNLATTISMLNSHFRMPSERITFRGSQIEFHNFKMLDSAGNAASVDGNVYAKDFANMELDLRVRARDWQALNSGPKDNDLFYGKLLLNTNMNIRGTTARPNIDGSLNILEGTDFTLVSPEKNPQIVSSEGIVRFIDKDMPGEVLPVMPEKDTVRIGLAPGSNINVNLTVDPEAKFSFIIDKATGDFINVKGEATVNTNVGNDGAITLTGMYKLNDGAYELNYNLIRRRFRIMEGSTILFAGDPLKAELNVTAIYTANIPSYDLVERQIPDPAQLNYYRQRLPFDVQLILKGEMMQPTITFNIDLPEDKVYRMAPDQLELVRSKLAQVRTDTSELTKQVFAVLLLNRFISDDPFSGTGANLEYTAKQSVSRFIGEQLNKFASDLVKGVELNVDLAQSEDYTTGSRRERTDLSLSASKSLLDDRLKITIGNDFELQGAQSSNNRNTSYIPGNLAADYNLTTDGRYVVRAYRKSYDEGVLQGFITETGLNFIVSIDYNRFAQLFRKTRTREDRRQNREDRKKQREAQAGTLAGKQEDGK